MDDSPEIPMTTRAPASTAYSAYTMACMPTYISGQSYDDIVILLSGLQGKKWDG